MLCEQYNGTMLRKNAITSILNNSLASKLIGWCQMSTRFAGKRQLTLPILS